VTFDPLNLKPNYVCWLIYFKLRSHRMKPFQYSITALSLHQERKIIAKKLILLKRRFTLDTLLFK